MVLRDSLKKRFAFLLAVSLLCLVGLVGSQVYYERTITNLDEKRILLTALSENLLKLRLEQNHLLNKNDTAAVEPIHQLVSELSTLLEQLYPLMHEYQLSQDQVKAIQQSFTQYSSELNRIIDISLEIGLDENSGLRSKFRKAAHRLEEQLQSLDDESLQIMLLQMRRNEKDFIERKNMTDVTEQVEWADKLSAAIVHDHYQKQDKLLPLLKEYQVGFDQLVILYEKLGLSSGNGVLQAFQTQSQVINERISVVSQRLETTVNTSVNNLKNLGMILVIATTGVLFVIVLNSFVTLRNGLKGFLGFFEIAKTGNAPVEIKALKFTEFHEVAEMAFEMIQAREKAEDHLRETSRKLEKANEELTKAATLDGLTGICNRRSLDQALTRECHRCSRDKTPLGVILMDIDHFKLYNDHYGHQAGDDTLIKVAQQLNCLTERATDVVARYGGEEFAVVLSNTDGEGAKHLAHKMVNAVKELALPHEKSTTSNVVTISAGVFAAVPTGDMPAEKWFTFADQALYKVKRSGRGQVCLQDESDHQCD